MTGGHLPECFEMEERTSPGVGDVLQLVSGRQLLGFVRERSDGQLAGEEQLGIVHGSQPRSLGRPRCGCLSVSALMLIAVLQCHWRQAHLHTLSANAGDAVQQSLQTRQGEWQPISDGFPDLPSPTQQPSCLQATQHQAQAAADARLDSSSMADERDPHSHQHPEQLGGEAQPQVRHCINMQTIRWAAKRWSPAASSS